MTDTASYPPHSRLPNEVWAVARADYESGASLRVVAERHGLNIRSVSRHARNEQWRSPLSLGRDIYEQLLSERRHRLDAPAEQAGVALVRDADDEQLLLHPDTTSLCRYAFRRSAESAIVSGPTEALAWARLAQAIARLRDRACVDVSTLNEADYRRVTALARDEAFACQRALDADDADDAEALFDEVSEVSESVLRNFTDADTLSPTAASPDSETP